MSAHVAENLHMRWFTGEKRTDTASLLSGIKTGRLHIINTNNVCGKVFLLQFAVSKCIKYFLFRCHN